MTLFVGEEAPLLDLLGFAAGKIQSKAGPPEFQESKPILAASDTASSDSPGSHLGSQMGSRTIASSMQTVNPL